ncbi:uncharacterized protein LTR77_002057 [Saxophila tyrrhenica]|uniref:Uncharacterized protein n=1 Tax=Saxophila tyrrhenica TaxID=1690608 RepID=A0AAV9PJ93_9PEZI|nr:hypothetical protein LTR77_002057 [Saxophila tyrrhenica]
MENHTAESCTWADSTSPASNRTTTSWTSAHTCASASSTPATGHAITAYPPGQPARPQLRLRFSTIPETATYELFRAMCPHEAATGLKLIAPDKYAQLLAEQQQQDRNNNLEPNVKHEDEG